MIDVISIDKLIAYLEECKKESTTIELSKVNDFMNEYKDDLLRVFKDGSAICKPGKQYKK